MSGHQHRQPQAKRSSSARSSNTPSPIASQRESSNSPLGDPSENRFPSGPASFHSSPSPQNVPTLSSTPDIQIQFNQLVRDNEAKSIQLRQMTERNSEQIVKLKELDQKCLELTNKVEGLTTINNMLTSKLKNQEALNKASSGANPTELERKLKKYEQQIADLNNNLTNLRRSGHSKVEAQQALSDQIDRLRRELDLRESQLRECEYLILDLQTLVKTLEEQLEVCRETNLETFRLAYENGDLEIHQFDTGEEELKAKAAQQSQSNMYSALMGDEDDDDDDVQPEEKHVTNEARQSSSSTMDSYTQKEIPRLSDELKKSQDLVEKYELDLKKLNESLEKAVKEKKEAQAESKEIYENMKKKYQTTEDELKLARSASENLRKIYSNVEKVFISPLHDVSKGLTGLDKEGASHLPKVVPNFLDETFSDWNKLKERISISGKLLSRVYELIPESTKAASGSKNDTVLRTEVNYLRDKLHMIDFALKKALLVRPVSKSGHKRSKEREDKTVIVRLIDKKTSIFSTNQAITAEDVKNLFSPFNVSPYIKTVRWIISDYVFIRTTRFNFQELLSMSEPYVNNNLSDKLVISHFPSWRQLIIHNFPISEYFYSRPDHSMGKNGNFWTMYTVCEELQLILNKCTISKVHPNRIAGIPRFFNPCEYTSRRSHVSLIVSYDDEWLFTTALKGGIFLPDSAKRLVVEPVLGPMKNVMSQAGFLALAMDIS